MEHILLKLLDRKESLVVTRLLYVVCSGRPMLRLLATGTPTPTNTSTGNSLMPPPAVYHYIEEGPFDASSTLHRHIHPNQHLSRKAFIVSAHSYLLYLREGPCDDSSPPANQRSPTPLQKTFICRVAAPTCCMSRRTVSRLLGTGTSASTRTSPGKHLLYPRASYLYIEEERFHHSSTLPHPTKPTPLQEAVFCRSALYKSRGERTLLLALVV